MPLMTKTELDELMAAGWEATTHGVGTMNIHIHSYSGAVKSLAKHREGVEALGPAYRKGSRFYVYPGGRVIFTPNVDGESTFFKALRELGLVRARLTSGGVCWSDGLWDLGLTSSPHKSLRVNYLRAPASTLYETPDPAARIQRFECQLQRIARVGGLAEFFTHNVVSRSWFPGGQPYASLGYPGKVSVKNDISIEAFTACMDLLARYRDRGLLEVVLKRDWYRAVRGRHALDGDQPRETEAGVMCRTPA